VGSELQSPCVNDSCFNHWILDIWVGLVRDFHFFGKQIPTVIGKTKVDGYSFTDKVTDGIIHSFAVSGLLHSADT